jgi:hypothetical protein
LLLHFRLADGPRVADPAPPRRPPARFIRYGARGLGLLAFALIPFAASAINRTPADIHARFSGVIWSQLNTPEAAQRLARLSDFEMEKLAALYINAAQGSPPLQGIIRKYAPEDLPRYEHAVAAVLAQRVVMHRPRQKAAAPTVWMSFDELYMEFRLAGDTVMQALYETGRFAGGELTWAASAGYTVGSIVSYGLQTYCTPCDNAIGAGVSQVVNYKAPPDLAPSGTQQGYGDPTGGFGQAGSGFGMPSDESDYSDGTARSNIRSD